MRVKPIDRDLARLAEAVYARPWSQAQQRVGAIGWTMTERFDHAGAEAMLCKSEKAAALVFRGTEASRFHVGDFAANVGRPTLWAGPGWAHRGYVQQLERIRHSARRMAEKASSRKPLYVTGHSKGGAMAVLYAAWVLSDKKHGHRLRALVTFGAPKSLTPTGAAAITCATRQYYIRGDLAPWWPPSFRLTNPGPHIRLRADSWWPGPITRHGVGEYIAGLGEALGV